MCMYVCVCVCFCRHFGHCYIPSRNSMFQLLRQKGEISRNTLNSTVPTKKFLHHVKSSYKCVSKSTVSFMMNWTGHQPPSNKNKQKIIFPSLYPLLPNNNWLSFVVSNRILFVFLFRMMMTEKKSKSFHRVCFVQMVWETCENGRRFFFNLSMIFPPAPPFSVSVSECVNDCSRPMTPQPLASPHVLWFPFLHLSIHGIMVSCTSFQSFSFFSSRIYFSPSKCFNFSFGIFFKSLLDTVL